MTTRILALPEVDLAHEVHGPLPPAEGSRALVMIGQPMTADGFRALASHFTDRTVVLYDPRGLGRSTTRRDGRDDQNPVDQAADLHAMVAALGVGPVDVFASSGGAVAGLEWAATHPDDIAVLVAHEPPLTGLLPDAELAGRAFDRVRVAYQERGFGAGMAGFIGLTMWPGEFTEEWFAQPLPDPAQFGMPNQDDGSRDDPLLSERSAAVTTHRPDLAALRRGSTRVVIGVGEEGGETLTARCARAMAAELGSEAVVFPGGHGGFGGEDDPYPGRATDFALRLRQVLGA